MSWPWSELGLEGPCELTQLRRAYAERLKTTHPEEDPEGFQRLHTAYKAARQRLQLRDGTPSGFNAREPSQQTAPSVADAESHKVADGRSDAHPFHAEKQPLHKESTPQEVWDYDALFQEAETEHNANFRRKAEAQRAQAAQKKQRQREESERAVFYEAEWQAVEAALHALELLYNTNAPLSQWKDFLSSETFLRAQFSVDFVFGLEDFISHHELFPQDVCRLLFSAYHFEKGRIPPAMHSLYSLLRKARGTAKASPKPKPTPIFQYNAKFIKVMLICSLLTASLSFLKMCSPPAHPPRYTPITFTPGASNMPSDIWISLHFPQKNYEKEFLLVQRAETRR